MRIPLALPIVMAGVIAAAAPVSAQTAAPLGRLTFEDVCVWSDLNPEAAREEIMATLPLPGFLALWPQLPQQARGRTLTVSLAREIVGSGEVALAGQFCASAVSEPHRKYVIG